MSQGGGLRVSKVRTCNETTESLIESPLIANECSVENTTLPRGEARKASGTDPPDDSKTLRVTKRSSKDNWEGGEPPVCDTVANGPPRVVPTSTKHGAKGALSGVGSEHPATTEGAAKGTVSTS